MSKPAAPTEVIYVRIPADQKRRFTRAAKAEGLPVTAWLLHLGARELKRLEHENKEQA